MLHCIVLHCGTNSKPQQTMVERLPVAGRLASSCTYPGSGRAIGVGWPTHTSGTSATDASRDIAKSKRSSNGGSVYGALLMPLTVSAREFPPLNPGLNSGRRPERKDVVLLSQYRVRYFLTQLVQSRLRHLRVPQRLIALLDGLVRRTKTICHAFCIRKIRASLHFAAELSR